MKKFFQRFFFLPLILIVAVAFVIFQVKSKAPVEHEETGYPIKPVKVITAEKIPFRVRATAYGNVEPAIILKVKSEVTGKISYMHPDLKQGSSIKKGTVVLRIEPTTFNISLNQSKAGLAASQSSLEQLQAEEKSTRRSLEIAQNNLKIGLKEVKRIQSLWKKHLIARSTLDKEEQKVLSLRQQVQDIEGKLSSYSSRKSAIRAQIKQSRSQVNKSKDTLGRTEVRLPFDARIGTVYVEEGEFTIAGSGQLFEALGVKAVEINAQLPTKQFRPLVAVALSDASNSVDASISLTNPKMLQKVMSKMDLQVRVRLVGELSESTYWDAKLIRLSEAVDPVRDTLGLIVRVEAPYEDVIPGKRPPLLKGMYTSVELLSPERPSLVLPRKAIHQGRVYLVNGDNTLAILPVHILYTQGNLVILDEAENSQLINKQVIISDVIPVMQGMPLKAISDEDDKKQLLREALGKKSFEPPLNENKKNEETYSNKTGKPS